MRPAAPAHDVTATMRAYDAVAEDYARLLPDMTLEAPLDRAVLAAFAEMLRQQGDPLVVDVGCGAGRVTKHLDDAGLRVIGLDLSPATAPRTPSSAPPAPPDSPATTPATRCARASSPTPSTPAPPANKCNATAAGPTSAASTPTTARRRSGEPTTRRPAWQPASNRGSVLLEAQSAPTRTCVPGCRRRSRTHFREDPAGTRGHQRNSLPRTRPGRATGGPLAGTLGSCGW